MTKCHKHNWIIKRHRFLDAVLGRCYSWLYMKSSHQNPRAVLQFSNAHTLSSACDYVPYFTEQLASEETNSHFADQEIFLLLWTVKVYYGRQ